MAVGDAMKMVQKKGWFNPIGQLNQPRPEGKAKARLRRNEQPEIDPRRHLTVEEREELEEEEAKDFYERSKPIWVQNVKTWLKSWTNDSKEICFKKLKKRYRTQVFFFYTC